MIHPPRHIQTGGLDIWALHDGTVSCTLDVLPDAGRAEAALLAAEGGFSLDPIRVDVNVFAFRGPLGLTLVDAGTGTVRGPGLGHAKAGLAACGIAPADVDVVVMTHLHVDHAAGLCEDGAAVFPRASLIVGEEEAAFWRSDRPVGRQTTQVDPARQALSLYAPRLHLVRAGELVAQGMEAVALPGHTPGLLGYRVAMAGGTLLFCGDISNLPALQLPRPAWAHVFDADPAAATATRLRVLRAAAQSGELLAGAHLPFPGIGRVAADGGGFAFRPI